jgi:hypothetical protein
MTRRIAAGLLIGAGCLVAEGASGATQLSRVPGSRLVSKPELRFGLSQSVQGTDQVTLLVHQPAAGEPFPLARISTSPGHVFIERLAAPAGKAPKADVNVAVTEHLYVLALRQEPEARFCLADIGKRCDPARQGYSQAELLRRLIEARRSALKRGDQAKAALPWRMVTMSPAAPAAADPDHVAVRVVHDRRPMEGATVFFHRAPHSSCVGKVGADGVAACELVDQHGHADGEHDDEGPVVVTYPGDIRKDVVLVPSTLVMK